jgi:outer membrane protein TolC
MTLSVPLFDLDVITAVLVTERQAKASGIQHTSNIASLVVRLKSTYYNLITALELLNSSEITIQRAEENLNLVKTKYELGAASRLELLQGEVFYLSALQDRARARTQHITAHEELKSILGIQNDIYPTDTLTAPDNVELPDIDSLLVMLQTANYNIQVAQQQRNVARLNLISSYVAFLPRISFFYGYNVSSDSLVFDFQYYRDNATKNYGVNISFPIFEIKSLIFKYLNAKKELQLQEFTQKRIVLETEKSLRTTYYALREAFDRLDLAGKSLDAANEASIIAKEQYAIGAISFLDFLAAEKDLYEAKVSYTSALSDFYIQRANLSYLLGAVSFSEEER